MKTKRGSALIEFAVALAVLTPVVMGGLQFSQAYLVTGQIQQAATQAAQAGAALPYDSANETPTPAFERAVQDAVLKASIPGLRREHIKVTMRFDGGRPSEVEVRISGYQVQVPGGAITLDGRPHAIYPYRGHWSPSVR